MCTRRIPIRVTSFYSALILRKLPDQLLEWNTAREPAFNLHDYTSHATLPISSVSYRVQINTDPRVGLSIDPSGNVNIHPEAGVEAESDVVILAWDPLNNQVTSAFHISVQKPRPARLEVPEEISLAPSQSQPLDVQVKDQWDRLLTLPVTVTFATTVGTVSPTSVLTSTGQARTTLTAGSTVGAGFVTTQVGGLSALTRIQSASTVPETWHRTGNMSFMRALHESVRLADGRVLTAGGWTPITELYDASTGKWQPAGELSRTRRSFTLTLLGDGRVLAVGGGGGEADTSAELYEPTTRTWHRTGSMAARARITRPRCCQMARSWCREGGLEQSRGAVRSGQGDLEPHGARSAHRDTAGGWHGAGHRRGQHGQRSAELGRTV